MKQSDGSCLTSALLITAQVLITLVTIRSGRATVVKVQTCPGDFEVDLADTSTHLSTAVFPGYVKIDRYTKKWQ